MLSAISQPQKDRCLMIPLIEESIVVRLKEAENVKVVASDWGVREMWSCCSISIEFQCC